MLVYVDPQSLERSRSGLVTGVVCLRGDGEAFPDDKWNDAPVIVLRWWLEELMRIKGDQELSVECRFMDGPFLFRVHPADNVFELKCVQRNRQGEHVVRETSVPRESFMNGVLGCASRVVDACDKNGWGSPDLDRLKGALKAARE